jgi:2-methylisocitrate lyase-like PEP mutase family enzyme
MVTSTSGGHHDHSASIDRRARFRARHDVAPVFVMPNPWDVGSARLLASMGFEALATTSAGLAWSLGRLDMSVQRDELLTHVEAVVAATDLPLNVDSVDDLDDTIRRLRAYRAAGADVLYAPGLADLAVIERVVREVGAPVNVLALPHGPSVAELGAVGVRRVSIGGSLAKVAYGALAAGAEELLTSGTSSYTRGAAGADRLAAAFGPGA